MGVEIEFIALPHPLPDAERKELIKFGQAAIVARINSDPRTTNTAEGQELDDFESRLRALIGVPHRRERLCFGGAHEADS